MAVTNFRISEETVKTLKEKGVETLFPIQAKTFDYVYEGRDVIGRARTGILLHVHEELHSFSLGTGKTLSYVLPILERLFQKTEKKAFGRLPKVICMCPTRELAIQVNNINSLLEKGVKLKWFV